MPDTAYYPMPGSKTQNRPNAVERIVTREMKAMMLFGIRRGPGQWPTHQSVRLADTRKFSNHGKDTPS